MTKYTCPVCGYLVFNSPPGSDEICPICFWHDDISQLRFPKELGANKTSLVEAQQNFQKFGAIDKEFIDRVKKQRVEEKDPAWKLLDSNIEEYQSGMDYGLNYPDDLTQLYYWRNR